MNKDQLELLLNQLYNCSLAIYAAIEKDDLNEIDNLIQQKNKTMKLLDTNKKFFNECFSLYDIMIEKIKKQENKNLQFLNVKKNEFYTKYKNAIKTAKILNKYEPSEPRSGSIVDASE